MHIPRLSRSAVSESSITEQFQGVDKYYISKMASNMAGEKYVYAYLGLHINTNVYFSRCKYVGFLGQIIHI